MWSFSELLYKNNVLFSYYGFIDHTILNEVLKVTKHHLTVENESVIVSKRLHNAINECVENIIKHNFFPKEQMADYKSLIVISKEDGFYVVDTINVVNAHQKEIINKQLNFITSKSKDELKVIKGEIISNNQYSEAATAGLGMVDMVLRTDDCIYGFKSYQSNFLFNIHFKINTTVSYAST
ncbi:MAG: DUF6272 family protein [Bacteroidota bacterium]